MIAYCAGLRVQVSEPVFNWILLIFSCVSFSLGVINHKINVAALFQGYPLSKHWQASV